MHARGSHQDHPDVSLLRMLTMGDNICHIFKNAKQDSALAAIHLMKTEFTCFEFKQLSQFPGNFILSSLAHCSTNPNPKFAMCAMMCWKKSKFQDESIKFEKISGASCETNGKVIFKMSLCGILKNHGFSTLTQSNNSQNT